MKAFSIYIGILFTSASVFGQTAIGTREMNRINWMAFAEFVPKKTIPRCRRREHLNPKA